MNIEQAKRQVENTVRAYLATDEFGGYLLPLESQRPVFLMGPAGIGKTAIVSQVAHEMGIGFVSYSMTHHTRQSALGLPFIKVEEFAGEQHRVSHYTMSEIVASVHEEIRASGRPEGILFLDEVNCVSETLAPAMLQFLQFKTFGTHRLPPGWVIVTAGNPPEYNSSVREFDMVTWDRLKRIDIEPDYEAWHAYALQTGVHPAVTSYLELKKHRFYQVEPSADGKGFVTARGWVDLARMIRLYEHCGMEVDADLVVQYLQDDDTARDFASYYRLYDKYRADYRIPEILAGKAGADIMHRAHDAAFDERLQVIGMLMDALDARAGKVVEQQLAAESMVELVLQVREDEGATARLADAFESRQRALLEAAARAGATVVRERRVAERCLAFLAEAGQDGWEGDAFGALKAAYDKRLEELKADAAHVSGVLENAFEFFEDVFGEGPEMLVFVTNLTASRDCSEFIGRYGCDKYFAHNDELMFYERQKSIRSDLDELGL